MQTEIIDKLFLELSQVTAAKTKSEINCLVEMDRCHKILSSAGVSQRGSLQERTQCLSDANVKLVQIVRELLTVSLATDCTAQGILERARALVNEQEI